MPHQYRAYFIKNDKVDIAAKVIVADSDDEAVKQTEPLVDGHDVELWQGPRFVRGFKSKDAKPPRK